MGSGVKFRPRVARSAISAVERRCLPQGSRRASLQAKAKVRTVRSSPSTLVPKNERVSRVALISELF
jgi:hypothetical protein